MRDRLIELLEQTGMIENSIRCKIAAQELMANGVIVPPCKVGTRVYVITSKTSNDKNFYIFEDTITHYRIVEGCTIMCFENHLGEPNWKWNNVFLTKEAAEKALRG